MWAIRLKCEDFLQICPNILQSIRWQGWHGILSRCVYDVSIKYFASLMGTTCSLNYLLLYCRGRAVTNVVRTCGPTPLHMFIAIKYD